MRARDRKRTARNPRTVRLWLRQRGSLGASSVEYGLIIALIGAVLCVGIGFSVKSMFDGVINCFVQNLQGISDPNCADTGGTGGSGGGGGGGGGITPGGVKPTPTPTPSPTATPTPTGTPGP